MKLNEMARRTYLIVVHITLSPPQSLDGGQGEHPDDKVESPIDGNKQPKRFAAESSVHDFSHYYPRDCNREL